MMHQPRPSAKQPVHQALMQELKLRREESPCPCVCVMQKLWICSPLPNQLSPKNFNQVWIPGHSPSQKQIPTCSTRYAGETAHNSDQSEATAEHTQQVCLTTDSARDPAGLQSTASSWTHSQTTINSSDQPAITVHLARVAANQNQSQYQNWRSTNTKEHSRGRK